MGTALLIRCPVMLKSAIVGCVLFVALAGAASVSTMPLFVWSGSDKVASGAKSVKSALSQNLKGSEVAMVYMMNEVSSHKMRQNGELTNLEESLSKAKSTAFAALPVEKVATEDIATEARSMGASVVTVKSTDLQAHLAAHPEIATNGKPDVVLVPFPSNANMDTVDSVVGAANKAVSAVTNKHLGILSTSNAQDIADATNLAFHYEPIYSKGNVAFTNGAIFGGTVSMLTPGLLVAILMMVFMGILALSAYCCLMSLQTPEMFEGDQKEEMKRALNPDSK